MRVGQKSGISTEIIYLRYDGAKLFFEVELPKRSRQAICTIEMSVSCDDAYVTNLINPVLSINNARLTKELSYYLDPGSQNHLFKRFELHQQYRLSTKPFTLDGLLPLVNDNFAFTLTMVILLQEYRIASLDDVGPPPPLTSLDSD